MGASLDGFGLAGFGNLGLPWPRLPRIPRIPELPSLPPIVPGIPKWPPPGIPPIDPGKKISGLKKSIASLIDMRPCCGDDKYNPLTECCCNETVMKRAKEETGVFYVESPINADTLLPSADHAWLEVDGDIWDFNPTVGMVNDVGEVNMNDLDPKYSTKKHRRFEDRTAIKLSPCKYDTAKFVKELKRMLKKQKTSHSKWSFAPQTCTVFTQEYGHNCQTWADGLIALAKENSERECK